MEKVWLGKESVMGKLLQAWLHPFPHSYGNDAVGHLNNPKSGNIVLPSEEPMELKDKVNALRF